MNKKYLTDFQDKKIYLVDGSYIRNNLDVCFARYGHSLSQKYIPQNEIWIESIENVNFDPKYFIKNATTDFQCMTDGLTDDQAEKLGDRSERGLRLKDIEFGSIKTDNNYKIKKVICKSFPDIPIYIVDGEKIRNTLNIKFIHGGNDQAYPNTNPKNEIWLEYKSNKKEMTYILLHELYERNLMVKYGYDYTTAHNKANIIENKARKNIIDLKDTLYKRLGNYKIL